MARTADAGAGSSVWRHAETAAYVESAERAVVVDLDHLDLPPYVFEGSAGQIWARVDGTRTEDEVARVLAEEYGVPPDVVNADVREFVERLGSLGLLVRVPAGDAGDAGDVGD